MTDGECYYDEEIAPALAKLARDAQAHGLSFFALVEWAPGEHGRTHYTVEGTQGFPFRMANWAAKCNGNVDAFWMAVQRYAMKHGHGSIFLQQQGIPSVQGKATDSRGSGVDVQRLVRQGGRLRQLIDGRWVAEERHGWWIFAKWIAIDLRTPRHLWKPDCQFYKDCIGTYEEAIRGLSMRGFSLPNAGSHRQEEG